MKILIVHGRYRSTAPSGENNVVDQERAALLAAGHDVELYERRSDDIAGWSLPRKAMLPVRSLWNGEVRRDLEAHLRRTRPDVVHVHNTFPLLSASILYACRDAGVPVVATIHNYKLTCASGEFFRDGAPCHDCAGTLGLAAVRHGCYRDSGVATLPVVASNAMHRSAWRELVSAYVFISAAQRDLMRSLDLPAERVFVKHNFVPPVEASPLPLAERDHSVIYLGRLDPAKGAPFLMRSWDAFRAAQPDSRLRLVIAGGGPLADDVAAWGAARDVVDVVGLLPRTEASALLRRSLAAVVPSQWEETFGLVAVEAMAAGVAAITPSRGSFPGFVTDGVDGALFDATDPHALAARLAEVDRDPEAFVTMGRHGRARAAADFDPAGNVEQLLSIYRFAVSEPANTLSVGA